MIRVTCFLRPHKLEEVKTAIADIGVGGMTVNDVRGRGNSAEQASLLGGNVVALPVRSKLTVVVEDADKAELVVQAILENAGTGAPGDGKIFLEPIEDAIRIRTGESGPEAV